MSKAQRILTVQAIQRLERSLKDVREMSPEDKSLIADLKAAIASKRKSLKKGKPMAAKKKAGKKKAGKKKSGKKRTPAQIRATKKLVAANKAKKAGKKKAGKRKTKKRKTSAPKAAAPKKTRKKSAPKKAAKKRSSPAKKTPKKRKLKERSVTLQGLMTGPALKSVNAAWICGGPKRTGCGGGKASLRGSRVLGVIK